MRVQNKDANNLADVYQNLVENTDVMKQYYDSLDKANNWAKENTVKSNHSKPDDLNKDGNTKDKKKKLCTKCKQEVNESLINTNYTLSTFNKTGVCKPCQDLHNQMYPNAKLNSEFGWII